jgi:predicted RNA-binding Zn ribbon-like protein
MIPFEQLGGRMCLDFLNTVSFYLPEVSGERLTDYGELLRFAREVKALDAGEIRALEREAGRRPLDAETALARARALRRAIYDLFLCATHQEPLPDGALATLNEALGSLAIQALICDGPGRCRLECTPPESLDAMLGPLARSAAELLASEEIGRVRMCEASERGTCNWMFLDTSKNRSRRWCSMKDCGNRAKARRHYERAKGA